MRRCRPASFEIPVSAGKTEGFEAVWQAMGGEKLSMGGEGQVTYIVHVPRGRPCRRMTLFFEAGAKRMLQKDRHIVGKAEVDHAFMRGYCVDRGAFDNSYWMTDETRFPSTVEVLVDDQVIDTLYLRNDWCDARGMLSWHAQPNDRLLDEGGFLRRSAADQDSREPATRHRAGGPLRADLPREGQRRSGAVRTRKRPLRLWHDPKSRKVKEARAPRLPNSAAGPFFCLHLNRPHPPHGRGGSVSRHDRNHQTGIRPHLTGGTKQEK